VRVRKFMPLVAAALIAVLTLAIGAGTGSAKTDVAAAPSATFKVTLVTDIGGLDDRSFNFLANKGLQDAKRKLGIQGNVFISKSDRDYIPNLTRAARDGSGLVIGVGFLMADSVSKVAKRFPKTKFAIIDNSGVPAELKDKPTNVRGLLFKEQEAGYLVGYLAARQIVAKPFGGQTMLGAVGGLKIPPVDRFIAGYYAGAKKASAKVKVVHNYSQDFVDQAKCKEQALNMIANGAGVVFQVAGQCGLGVLSAAKEKKVFGIGVDADQGYLGPHVMTSAT
jgi:basic membrane protein A and related proteins